MLNTICVIIITIILSYFTLVLGELVPKRVAMFSPEMVARFAIGVITILEKVLRPIIWLMSKSTNLVLKLMRIDPEKEGEQVTEEEIRMMVDLARKRARYSRTKRK